METSKTVFEKEETLYLNTGMNQTGFAKCRFTERLAEKGMLAQKEEGVWKFSYWGFTGAYVKSSDVETTSVVVKQMNERVFVTGKAFAGKTLKEYFDDEADGSANSAALAVCRVMEAAAERGVKIPVNGAGGIYLSDDFEKILFLPESVFEGAVTPLKDEEFRDEEGAYICRSLKGPSSLRFTQSVIAYRALTKKFPFAAKTKEERHEDYLDHNFVRLADCINGVNEELAFYIDNSLLRQAKTVSHSHKKFQDKKSINERITSTVLEKSDRKRNEEEQKKLLRAGAAFPLNLLEEELNKTERTPRLSEEKFRTEVSKRYSVLAKKIKVIRFFRNNSTVITVMACLAAAFAIGTYSTLKNNSERVTTRGLTSFQTVQMFYANLNKLDTVQAQECVKGKQPMILVDSLSNFYVVTKQRAAYEPEAKFVPPASWLVFNNDCKYNICGFSKVNADGIPIDLKFDAPLKKEKLPFITEEDGKLLEEGDTKNYTVKYYMILTEGVDKLLAIECTNNLTLTYHKNIWRITQNEQEQNEVYYDWNEFIEDYKAADEQTGKVASENINILSQKYPFISTQAELVTAKELFDKEYEEFAQTYGFDLRDYH